MEAQQDQKGLYSRRELGGIGERTGQGMVGLKAAGGPLRSSKKKTGWPENKWRERGNLALRSCTLFLYGQDLS